MFGLGIPHVGAEKAKILASYFKTMDKLMQASKEELIRLPDIGDVVADSVISYLADETHQKLITKLKDSGLNMTYLGTEITLNENFAGKKFVLTGTLKKMTRDEAKKTIEKLGGKTIESVSKKTDVVIVGDNPGSKYDKAQALQLTIWDEDDFLQKIKLID